MSEKSKGIILAMALILPFLLVGSIFLPGLLTSRIAAHETMAMTSLLSLYDAEMKFLQNNENRYGTLRELAEAGLIDTVIETGIKHGYRFEILLGNNSFEAHATPLIYGRAGFSPTGCISYFINEQRVFTNADKNGGKASGADKSVWAE